LQEYQVTCQSKQTTFSTSSEGFSSAYPQTQGSFPQSIHKFNGVFHMSDTRCSVCLSRRCSSCLFPRPEKQRQTVQAERWSC
jgi:hypothetical protein